MSQDINTLVNEDIAKSLGSYQLTVIRLSHTVDQLTEKLQAAEQRNEELEAMLDSKQKSK